MTSQVTTSPINRSNGIKNRVYTDADQPKQSSKTPPPLPFFLTLPFTRTHTLLLINPTPSPTPDHTFPSLPLSCGPGPGPFHCQCPTNPRRRRRQQHHRLSSSTDPGPRTLKGRRPGFGGRTFTRTGDGPEDLAVVLLTRTSTSFVVASISASVSSSIPLPQVPPGWPTLFRLSICITPSTASTLSPWQRRDLTPPPIRRRPLDPARFRYTRQGIARSK